MTNANSSYGRARAAAKVKLAAPPTTAIQMIARFFGGRLDAFFGFAQAKQSGYRGPTPSHKERKAERLKIQLMKLVPFRRPSPKPPSARDVHRSSIPGKPAALEFA